VSRRLLPALFLALAGCGSAIVSSDFRADADATVLRLNETGRLLTVVTPAAELDGGQGVSQGQQRVADRLEQALRERGLAFAPDDRPADAVLVVRQRVTEHQRTEWVTQQVSEDRSVTYPSERSVRLIGYTVSLQFRGETAPAWVGTAVFSATDPDRAFEEVADELAALLFAGRAVRHDSIHY